MIFLPLTARSCAFVFVIKKEKKIASNRNIFLSTFNHEKEGGKINVTILSFIWDNFDRAVNGKNGG